MINYSEEQYSPQTTKHKSLMDHVSRLEVSRQIAWLDAWKDGWKQGYKEGRKEGRIEAVSILRELLKLPKLSLIELQAKDEFELTQMINDLKQQFPIQ